MITGQLAQLIGKMSDALSIVGRLLVEGSAAYLEAKEIEEANDYSDAMESMERKYWEGYTDALYELESHLLKGDANAS